MQAGAQILSAKLKARLSSSSPTEARLIKRSSHPRGHPIYTIQLGTVLLPGVRVDEIFDYVSPQDLEVFENAILRKETAKDHLNYLEGEAPVVSQKRSRGRPRKNPLAAAGDTSDESASTASSDDQPRVGSKRSSPSEEPIASSSEPQGRNGRPRPSYEHLYKKQRARSVRVIIQAKETPVQGSQAAGQ